MVKYIRTKDPFLYGRPYVCLVTLTDLQTRRAGLSESAELLVVVIVNFFFDDLF